MSERGQRAKEQLSESLPGQPSASSREPDSRASCTWGGVAAEERDHKAVVCMLWAEGESAGGGSVGGRDMLQPSYCRTHSGNPLENSGKENEASQSLGLWKLLAGGRRLVEISSDSHR